MPTAKSSVPDIDDETEAAIQEGIAADPDNPELTEEQLASMRPASEVLPRALYEALIRRGRPKADIRKVQVTLRLDPHVVEAFRAAGPGWQTRINRTLSEAVGRMSSQTRSGGDEAPIGRSRKAGPAR